MFNPFEDQFGDIIIAEYPLADGDASNEMYKFYQNKVAQGIRKLSEPRTTSILKWMGVNPVRKDGAFTPPFLKGIKPLYFSSPP